MLPCPGHARGDKAEEPSGESVSFRGALALFHCETTEQTGPRSGPEPTAVPKDAAIMG